MGFKIFGFLAKYKHLYVKLKQLCFDSDPKKTALALTLGVFIGIVPVLGITFISITAAGIIFRLKQIIIQTTHLLISPIQILFIPIFIKVGHALFAPSNTPLIDFTTNGQHLSFFEMINQFGYLILYGFFAWLIFSVIAGTIVYRVCVVIFTRRMERKTPTNIKNLPGL